MNNPLRKEREDITTADIAKGSRPEPTGEEIIEGRPKLVQSERSPTGIGAIAQSESVETENRAEQERRTQDDRTVRENRVAGQPQDADATPLFPQNELQDLRTNWDRIQVGFVDEPRRAVEQADSLVASTMKRLAEVFAQERSKLEQQWDRGDNVSTEDLRVALQRYRSFFHRLMAI
jgi:hypothetical protein